MNRLKRCCTKKSLVPKGQGRLQGLCLLTLLMFAAWPPTAQTQVTPGDPLLIWPNLEGTPSAPTITPYLPLEKNTGVAIVVCPGGGYGNLALDHEGEQIGQWLVGEGITAFVLQYRHAPDFAHPIPMQDVQRAVCLVRYRAAEWSIDPQKIGVLGFSAGGHLTATAGTRYLPPDPNAEDPVLAVGSRPNFLCLLYPVITMTDPYTHTGSRKNLLGENPSQELIDAMSAEKQVTAETPPSFIAFTTEDQAVPVQNGLLFYEALVNAGVPAEMHLYEKGRHGLGLGSGNAAFATWPTHFIAWLQVRAIL